MMVVGEWTAACAGSVLISGAGLQQVALPALTGGSPGSWTGGAGSLRAIAEPAMLRRIADVAARRAGFGIESALDDERPPALRDRSRVLVTGAAGFLGSHLCERLVASGHNVVSVDARMTRPGRFSVIPEGKR